MTNIHSTLLCSIWNNNGWLFSEIATLTNRKISCQKINLSVDLVGPAGRFEAHTHSTPDQSMHHVRKQDACCCESRGTAAGVLRNEMESKMV